MRRAGSARWQRAAGRPSGASPSRSPRPAAVALAAVTAEPAGSPPAGGGAEVLAGAPAPEALAVAPDAHRDAAPEPCEGQDQDCGPGHLESVMDERGESDHQEREHAEDGSHAAALRCLARRSRSRTPSPPHMPNLG